MVQSLAGEAGFDIKLQAAEANALVAAGRAGNYQATIVIWSGRPDPDGNVAIWLACDGFLNWGKYCNPTFDDLLSRARGVTDVVQRQALYRQLVDVYLADPRISCCIMRSGCGRCRTRCPASRRRRMD